MFLYSTEAIVELVSLRGGKVFYMVNIVNIHYLGQTQLKLHISINDFILQYTEMKTLVISFS